MSEKELHPPDLSMKFSTDSDDEDDSSSWDIESYQDIDYTKIVIDFAEDYFDSNLQNVDKKDVYCCCHEYENHYVSRAQKFQLQAVNICHNRYLKYMCEKQLHPPNLSPTDYDNQDEDDFLTWDLESYRESNYMEIVLGLSEEYFGYSDFNSQQDYKQNLFFRCDENENHQISSAQKVESQAMNDCENRNPKLSR
ncbi:uncharacterized protein LOC111626704 isoform X1 [Centruroides sculpturatus]|uniref:uncharacterized protein LOC111626704 isoform X1 n=1 Tax=Centruroides sculpturatus TaxID=218467 RepID=UPI000C6C8DB3|nr:uncharacterized protein LOC111626704 isoform X1 [Centruroides sculpturatus]XP_023225955.1 uncharacterized protein LOC111626704 isoform X1 [Centruroides sculpturatus]XP_023225956.1 uncharacterized protein LOC111626704 isoform X1 [Centruroides sculpturatus]XP_023225957.1 uncharacterized protein LOC111626704 isoform X1 [Centruroides sculpturatus]